MKLLIVDDNDTNLKIFNMILSVEGHEIRIAKSLEEITERLFEDVDLVIISDKIKCNYEEIKPQKVIILTSIPSVEKLIKLYIQGIKDYILLPANADKIKKIILSAITKNKSIEKVLSGFKHVQNRDNSSSKHLERMKCYSKILAKELQSMEKSLGIDENFIKNLGIASILHDIGKTQIPDEILQKPAKLTEEEFNKIKEHSYLGYKMLDGLENSPFVDMTREVVLSHHERYDGTGYPNQIADSEIPLSASIVAICDVYDALRETRVYKENFTHEKSVEIIVGSSGKQFNPIVVEAFENVHQQFDETFNKLYHKKRSK